MHGMLSCLWFSCVDCVRNVMAHAQKPDFAFRRNGRVHLNRRGRQFSQLLAAEVCASGVVMLDTPCSKVVRRVLATHSIRQFPLHFPSRASPCVITFQPDFTHSRVTVLFGRWWTLLVCYLQCQLIIILSLCIIYNILQCRFVQLIIVYFRSRQICGRPNFIRRLLQILFGVIKSRRQRWVGRVTCIGEGRNLYRGLVGNPEGMRSFGRPRRRWEDNIKMQLQEVGPKSDVA